MRRFALLLTLASGLLLATAAPAQAPKATAARDWRTSVVMLPSGAYAIGNPAAKVRLIEYLSYTCPHCAHFVGESKAPLHDDLVRRGAVRVEFRHAVRDPLDMAATLLARCAGARGFTGASEAIFAAQSSWFNQGATWWQANGAALQTQPQLTQLKGAANGSGLAQLMRGRGMTAAAINQCFATPADLKRVEVMTSAAWASIQGTPSFVINGKPAGSSDWAGLEPQLRAAGAR
jgi:protein-disulfide isomerase